METNCFRWAFTRLGVILCASDPRRDYQEPATPAVVRRGNNIDEFEKWKDIDLRKQFGHEGHVSRRSDRP
jgi:hypothetical protein